MIDDATVKKIQGIGAEMREAITALEHGRNNEEIADRLKHLADEAVSVSDYHDYIFEKSNVMRSHASSFKSTKEHGKEIKEALDTAAKLEKWHPADVEHDALNSR